MARAGGKNNSLKQPKEEVNIKYMHRPPTITPNYGFQRRSMLPKSKVSRVLLYDNATQDHMLDIKLAHINIEKERISRIINLHKRSFSFRQSKKQQLMQQLAKSTDAKKNNDIKRAQMAREKLDKSQLVPSKSNEIFTTNPSPDPDNEATENEENGELNVDSNNDKTNNETTENTLVDTPKDTHRDTPKEIPESVKFPAITETDKRHVIFKVKDTHGKTKVYHTIDPEGILNELLPLYPKLTDDPRFRSLQDLLVPTYYGASAEV